MLWEDAFNPGLTAVSDRRLILLDGNFSNKAIPTAFQGFNEPWVAWLVVEPGTELRDRLVQTTIEISLLLIRPECRDQVAPRNQSSIRIEKQFKDLCRLGFQPQTSPVPGEFTRPEVEREG